MLSPARRKLRPADWGLGMTLCLASIASNGKGIVAVSDFKLDLASASGEGQPKWGRLNKWWAAMYAGPEVSNATSVMEHVAEALEVFDEAGKRADRSDVEKMFQSEMQNALNKAIEARVLSLYSGMTVKQFVDTGLRKLGPEAFGELRQQMAAVTLGYEFLVFGFDSKCDPHLVHVQERAEPKAKNVMGFWAIGSGDISAWNSLFFHNYQKELPLRSAAYYLCAAKFVSEGAGLGPGTDVACLMKDGRLIGIDVAAIRRLWAKSGRPKIPKNLWNRMPPYKPIEGRLKTSDDRPPIHLSSIPSGHRLFSPSISQEGPPIHKSPKRGRKDRPASQE